MRTRLLLPLAISVLALGALSPTGMDPRVATGELAALQARWADCSQVVFPAQDDIADLADTLPRWGRYLGGQQLWPQWRVAAPPADQVGDGEWAEAPTAPSWAAEEAERPGGPSALDTGEEAWGRVSTTGAVTRTDAWFDPAADRLTTVTSTSSMQGCTRIVLSANRNLQIGVRASDVSGLAGQRVRWPEIKPEDHRGNALIRIYRDGRPVAYARVRMWVDRIGDYTVDGIAGSGFGHDHVAESPDAPPSLRLVMFPLGEGDSLRVLERGRVLESRVDANGEYRFGLQTGFRGGVERVVVEWMPSGSAGAGTDPGMAALLAKANPPAQGNKAAISVAARHGRLRHWHTAISPMHSGPKTEGLQYPFILTGQNATHGLTHYAEPTVIFDFYNALLDLWRQDLTEEERYKAILWAGGPKKEPNDTTKPAARWLQLSDMSLEYGGVFSTTGAGNCLDPMVGNHTGHTIGFDLDLGVCYSDNEGRPVEASRCRTADPARGLRPIKFSLLEAIMARQYRAAVYGHGPGGGDPNASAGGDLATYHIRMPLRGGLIPLVNMR